MKVALAYITAMLFIEGCIQRRGHDVSVPLDHPAHPQAPSASLHQPTTVFSDVPSTTPSASLPQDGRSHEHHR